MNSTQAKNIDLPDLMARLGFKPVKVTKGGNKYWYHSPFRKEEDASLNVSRGQKWNWVWNDFGDVGGTVVDFIMRLKNCGFKEALQFLEDLYERERIHIPKGRVGERPPDSQVNLFSFYEQKKGEALDANFEGDLELIRADRIKNPLIHTYLVEERAIPRLLIDRYLKEIRYRNRKSGKEFFAFGMENISGGYEIRAATDEYAFKSVLKKRDISVIKGSSQPSDAINIFEGMTDFLSLCAMYNTQQLRYDSIIMHSLSSYSKVGEWLANKSIEQLNLFLDNDDSGRKYVAKFKEDFTGKITDQSQLYTLHKDINQALKESKGVG